MADWAVFGPFRAPRDADNDAAQGNGRDRGNDKRQLTTHRAAPIVDGRRLKYGDHRCLMFTKHGFSCRECGRSMPRTEPSPWSNDNATGGRTPSFQAAALNRANRRARPLVGKRRRNSDFWSRSAPAAGDIYEGALNAFSPPGLTVESSARCRGPGLASKASSLTGSYSLVWVPLARVPDLSLIPERVAALIAN